MFKGKAQGIVLTLVGVAFLIASVGWYAQIKEKDMWTGITTGVVTRIDLSRLYVSGYYIPIIEYKVGDVTYEYTDKYGSDSANIIGKEVTVYYNERKPHKATLAVGRELSVMWTFTLCAGVSFGCGVPMLVTGEKKDETKNM